MTDESLYHARIRVAEPGVPLLFCFHGTGGDENQFFGLAEEMMPDAGIVSPKGDVSERGAARFFRRTAEGVYDMADLAARTDKMAAFVAAHIHRARPGPRIGLGYSNGANILANVAFHRPDLFDAIVLMHPLIPFEPTEVAGLEKVSVLITAGQTDPICPEPQTRALIDFYRVAGAPVTEEWHPGGHEVRPNEVEAIRRFLRAAGSPTGANAA